MKTRTRTKMLLLLGVLLFGFTVSAWSQKVSLNFNNERVELTKTEFAILWLLCENRGNVVKSDVLFSSVWKENYFEKDNNTIMVHIRHIREKMKDTYSKPKYIKTIYGVGYKIEK